MPVFPDIKKIFVHIPRTGGTSILEYLKSKSCTDAHFKNFKHYTLNDYKIVDEFESYTLFTIVRNPYDRMVSYFNYHVATDANVIRELYSEIKDGNLYDVFNLYLNKSLCESPCKFGREKPLLLSRTQSSFLDLKCNINILKFENLNYEFNMLMKEDCKLPHITSIPSGFKPYTREEFFSLESIDIIQKYYNEDFLNFNYNYIKT